MSCKVNLPAFFIIFSPFSVSWQLSHRWSFSLIWRTGSNRWRAAWTRRKKKSSRPAVQLRSLKSCRISRYLNRLCFHFFLCIYFNWLYLKGYFSASLYFELRQPIINLLDNQQASIWNLYVAFSLKGCISLFSPPYGSYFFCCYVSDIYESQPAVKAL